MPMRLPPFTEEQLAFVHRLHVGIRRIRKQRPNATDNEILQELFLFDKNHALSFKDIQKAKKMIKRARQSDDTARACTAIELLFQKPK